MQKRFRYSSIHPDDPDAPQAACDWAAYPDLDGRAIDFFGETPDPALSRKVHLLKTAPQAGQPIQPGMLAFLHTILTAKEVEVFVMAEGYGASETQIAAALGISQQSVNGRLSTARRRCRRWIENQPKPTLQVAA